jgi:hypothetical protein
MVFFALINSEIMEKFPLDEYLRDNADFLITTNIVKTKVILQANFA